MGWLTHELNNLKLEKHPDKAFIGRIERGFDFRDIILHRSGWASRRRHSMLFMINAIGFTSKSASELVRLRHILNDGEHGLRADWVGGN